MVFRVFFIFIALFVILGCGSSESITDSSFETTDKDILSIYDAPPQITKVYPSSGENIIDAKPVFKITFDEEVSKVAGKKFSIYLSDGDIEHTVYDMSEPSVVVDQDKVTVVSKQHLSYGKRHYIKIDRGAFKDSALNDFAGIDDKWVWSFTLESSSGPCGCDEFDNSDLPVNLQ